MNNQDKILKLLHKVFRNDRITNEISKVTGYQIDRIELQILDIDHQFFLDTATWGLDIFEKELNLEHVSAKPESERRSVISAKWRGAGKLTLELIKQTVNAFINGEVDVVFTGIIEINFSSQIGRPPNMNDVYRAIEDIKPAHLGVKYIFRYRIHQELKEYLHWELQAITHNEIQSREDLEDKIVNRYYMDVVNQGYTCDTESTDRQIVREKFRNAVLQKLTDNGYDKNGNPIHNFIF